MDTTFELRLLKMYASGLVIAAFAGRGLLWVLRAAGERFQDSSCSAQASLDAACHGLGQTQFEFTAIILTVITAFALAKVFWKKVPILGSAFLFLAPALMVWAITVQGR